MKAKEELIKLVLDNDFITAPRLVTKFRSLLDRVEIEAQAEFKNCNIPPVSNAKRTCFFCDAELAEWQPESDNVCNSCADMIKAEKHDC